MQKFVIIILWIAGTLMLMPGGAFAVGTSYWTQSNEADFKSGTLENIVATNLGDLKLSRAVKTLLDQDPQVSSVNVLAEAPDGSIYAGTGPHGLLLQIKDEKVTTLATFSDTAAVLSILVDGNGKIFVGTGGESGRVMQIDKPGDKPRSIFESPGVQYVWAMARTPDGNIYAATGPSGQLFEIKPDGTNKVILETEENNLLSLISDGKDLLYAGTDPHGLIYRVNRKTGESFVLYNCAESEVSALVMDGKGNLYAGTSEAREDATSPAEPAAAPEKNGRPEGGAVGVPIPADRPKEPTPAPPPNPNPGQPDPIPKTAPRAAAHQQALMHRRAMAVAKSMAFQPVARCQANAEHRLPVLSQHAEFAFSRAGLASSLLDIWQNEVAAPIVLTLADESPAPADGPPNDMVNKKHPRKPAPGRPPVPNPNPGKPDPSPSPQTVPAHAPAHQPNIDTTLGAEPRSEGNAIYKIDPEGFVTEVFRQPVLILSMVENNGTLLVATGGAEGQVYQLRPAADETVVLAKVDAKQIMCLLSAHDGKIYMGTANVGTVAAMSEGFAARGTFASPVLDATQISRFGKLHLHGALPQGTAITVATRSGNVKEADEKTWSKWSDEAPAAEFMTVMSPASRFLQYRLTLTSAQGQVTPVVRDVSIAYQVPNLPPQIKSVKVANSTAGAEAAADADAGPRRVESARHQTISWEASDANNDVLVYSIYLRPAGEPEWILMKDKLAEATYEWDTRLVADGRYEVKIVASDAPSNPPGTGKTASRVSEPVTVDNTPPVIGDIKSQQRGGDMHIDLKVVDRTSTVAAVDYSVDSNKEWQLVLPNDQIYDSPEETVSFVIPSLRPGQHQVSLRATDSKGNQSFENLFVTVQGPAASR